MRKLYYMIGFMTLMALLVGCETTQSQQAPQLTFEAVMNVNADQSFHVSLGVYNAGEHTFEGDEQFNAEMTLRRASGKPRAGAEVVPLREIEPGDTAWPLDWEGQLEPGAYELTWGAQGYGSTHLEFTIVELNGRLYMAENAPNQPSREKEEDTGAAAALVAQAIVDLAERLNIPPDQIAVENIQATEFSDASLGVPQPGESYIQILTPGYVILLEAQGEIYEYHAAGERVVLLPAEGQETAARYQEIQVPEMNLRFEIPGNWQRLEPEYIWAPGKESDLRLAFKSIILQPPMELEAALLPEQAQILASTPLSLAWGEGRRFTLERYPSAIQGGDIQAPPEAVETHALFSITGPDGRLGLDFYTSAPDAAQLESLMPELEHMLDSVELLPQ